MKQLIILVLFLFPVVSLFSQTDVSSDLAEDLTFPYPTIDAIWDVQADWDVTAASGGAGNAGSEFDGTFYYSTRWASNLLHKYDINGNLVQEFSIPGVSGLRDLAYDGQYFYGGAAATTIFQMDFSNQTLVSSFTSPIAVRHIAYDSDNDAFWVGDWSTAIYLVSKSGTVLASIPAATHGATSIYGSAYDNVSVGGPYLWLFAQGAGAGTPQFIHQIQLPGGTPTGVMHDVLTDVGIGNVGAIAGGLFTTADLVPGTFSLGGLLQGTPNEMFAYEIAEIIPVELTSFTGKVVGNDVELRWSTATETNNHGFEVEKFINGKATTIGFVNGKGTTTETQTYSFVDKGVTPGNYSYRLRQVDLDGKFSYTHSIEVEIIAPAEFSLDQNYPNPFNPTTKIAYGLAVDSKVTITVYNAIGQEVATIVNANIAAGQHSIDFNAAGLNSGIYIYRLDANGIDGSSFSSVKKMTLMK